MIVGNKLAYVQSGCTKPVWSKACSMSDSGDMGKFRKPLCCVSLSSHNTASFPRAAQSSSWIWCGGYMLACSCLYFGGATFKTGFSSLKSLQVRLTHFFWISKQVILSERTRFFCFFFFKWVICERPLILEWCRGPVSKAWIPFQLPILQAEHLVRSYFTEVKLCSHSCSKYSLHT